MSSKIVIKNCHQNLSSKIVINISKALGSLFNVKKQKVAQWVSHSLSQWQGHLLSCLVTAKNVLQRLTKTDIMQLLANLFLLAIAHQGSLISGLRVIDNGLGVRVLGAEETMVDYALLVDDQKADLPSQVQDLSFFFDWNHKCWPVHHLLVCNYGGFANSSLLLSTSSPVRETLDYTLHGPSAWQRGAPIQIFGKSVKLPSHF